MWHIIMSLLGYLKKYTESTKKSLSQKYCSHLKFFIFKHLVIDKPLQNYIIQNQ